jgi:hypothetical protein
MAAISPAEAPAASIPIVRRHQGEVAGPGLRRQRQQAEHLLDGSRLVRPCPFAVMVDHHQARAIEQFGRQIVGQFDHHRRLPARECGEQFIAIG